MASLPHAYASRGSLRRRGVAATLALGLEILLGIAFLSFLSGAAIREVRKQPAMIGFDAVEDPAPVTVGDAGAPTKGTEAPPEAAARVEPIKVAPPPATPPISVQPNTPPPTPPTPAAPVDLVSGHGAPAAGPAPVAAGVSPADGASKTGASEGAGTGAAGERIYDAEWVYEPRDWELNRYKPRRIDRGWGEVICRTIPKDRVTDCYEIAEFPRGSGLARAVRRTSGAFRIRAPRIGGQPQIGVQVRVRVTYKPLPIPTGLPQRERNPYLPSGPTP